MTQSPMPRLLSVHLEDLAFITLSARPDGEGFELYPELDDELRSRLRSRIKQLSRYDWPSSVRDDPAFRRGFTLQQCFRLMIALLLLDAHLPPSLAVMLAHNNELGFMRAIAAAMGEPASKRSPKHDMLAVILSTEIQASLAFPDRLAVEEGRVRFEQRGDLARLWADDLAASGARLIVNITAASSAVWRWISERRLMDDTARLTLLAAIELRDKEPAFEQKIERKLRR